ncbi:MAG: bifunctional 5,10-methylenetetrahydrofolate dehydrogenase/5,10-methenyltetrahydrofolate cyclohydrolase [bacterium]|nr:bifunctional 5,10-methylenetetrahydrofolate dehydrogenase/5,10-methenyltetrahydrofolate cyclohydrolase [bacterium]
MTATILSGQEIANNILSNLREKNAGQKLQLAVLQVGDNSVSTSYIQKKKEAAAAVGIEFLMHSLESATSQQDVIAVIASIAKNPEVTGLVVQLPLPKHLNAQAILDSIPVEKDPDMLSSLAFGMFALGTSPILPPTVAAVEKLLEAYKIEPEGKKVALIGSGRLVGLPLSLWLSKKQVTVTTLNRSTPDLSSHTKEADIIISGAGSPNLIKASMVKKGAVVIDLGTSVEEGRTTGDVDFEDVVKQAGAVTPVPGGVGPLTVACLLENLVTLSSWTSKY